MVETSELRIYLSKGGVRCALQLMKGGVLDLTSDDNRLQ